MAAVDHQMSTLGAALDLVEPATQKLEVGALLASDLVEPLVERLDEL